MNVGIVGVGFMGMIHYLAYEKVRGARVTAICTRDAKKRAGDWRSIKGNFGPPGRKMDLKGVAAYADWRELIDDESIDLVDICLPPAMHEEVALAAFAAGKHVFCEKPLALSSAAARRMVKAAERAGKQLLVGHVLPFMPEFAFARKAIESGEYGPVLGGQFKRIISDPLWIKDFYDPDKVGGPVIDLLIHDAHFVRLLFGMPASVFSTGRMRGDVVEFVNTQFLFADCDMACGVTGGVIGQQGRGFTHGFEIHLERATIVFDFAIIEDKPIAVMPLTVFTANGKARRPKLPATDGFVAELTEAARAVRAGEPSPVLSGALALDALVMCEKQTQSVVQKKIVRV